MDFNIKDFDLRLKSIKIWELVIGIVISFVFGLIFFGYSQYFEY